MRTKVSEQVRQIIRTCGLSRYAICQRTGLDQGTLSKVLSGQRRLSSKALDTLGELLDLEIKPRKSQKGGRS